MKKLFNSLLANFKKTVHILSIVKNNSPKFLISVIFKGILLSLLPFVNIFFSYLILDGLIRQIDANQIYIYVIIMITLDLLIGVSTHVASYNAHKYGVELRYNLKNAIAKKAFELDYEQLEDNEIMGLIKKAEEGSNGSGDIVNYCENIFFVSLNYFLQLIYSIVLLVGLLSVKEVNSDDAILNFLNNPASALIILFSLIGVTIISSFLSMKVNKKGYQALMENIEGNRKFGYFFRVCNDYELGKDIRLFGMHDMIISLMSDKKNSVDSTWRKYVKYSIQYQLVASTLSHILLFIAYMFVGLKAIYGLVSIGNVLMYVSSITTLGASIGKILFSYIETQQSNHYLDNFFEFLSYKTKMKYGTKPFVDSYVEIEFKNVSFSYPHQIETIINDVSFVIPRGKKIALVGQNGAGKTTLIKLMCRLYEPTKGDIFINGTNIKEYSKESLKNIFSVVFQDFKLFSYSIKDNVTGGELLVDKEKVMSSLDKAGVLSRVNKMDKGIDSILYQRNALQGIEISGGEAQKIAIARALYKDGPFVILDEPTSALDPISESEIYSRFKDMTNSKTSLFISHRMSSCKFCDEVLVFDKGQIVEQGSHRTLLRNSGGLYKKMWDAQAKYYK